MFTQQLQTACKRTAIAAAITMALVVGIPAANAYTALEDTVNVHEMSSQICEWSEGLANYADELSSDAAANSQDYTLVNDQSDDLNYASNDQSDDSYNISNHESGAAVYVSNDEPNNVDIVSNDDPSDLATENDNQLAYQDDPNDNDLEGEYNALASINDSHNLQDVANDDLDANIDQV
jgi:hypothetical protein